MDYVYEYLISFAVAFIVAFMMTPFVRRLAFKFDAVDYPDDARRIHKKPMPRMGGLAIFCGFVVAMIIAVLSAVLGLTEYFAVNLRMLGFILGSIVVVGLGVLDDIYSLNAKLKFAVQVCAAAIVIATGTSIGVITNPFSADGATLLPPVISIPLTILWIVGITNSINLIDGLDGLAAGVSSIASLSLMMILILENYTTEAIIMAAVAGATLGFLPYNFNPAKIFMGDTGPYFLGFTLAVVSIMPTNRGSFKMYTAVAIAIPILVLGLPIFDTLFAIVRRMATGKSIMAPDRGHLHHRLLDMGLSQKQSVVVMYSVSALLGLSAIVMVESGVIRAVILIAAVAVFVIAGMRYMNTAEGELEAAGEDDDDDSEEDQDDDSDDADDNGSDDEENGTDEHVIKSRISRLRRITDIDIDIDNNEKGGGAIHGG